MKFVLIFFMLFANLACICKSPVKAFFTPTKCSPLAFSFKKNRIINPPASCGAVALSRKVAINCTPNSGTQNLCTSSSTNSNYFFIFVPNNNNGTFIDSTVGQINDCAGLWNAIGSSNPPTDIYGAYYSNSTAGDFLNCTDLGGCNSVSATCISSWDSVNQAPTSTTLSIPDSTNLLVCGFIDANSINVGIPPPTGSGVPAVGISNSFMTLSTTSGNLNFNSWFDY